jgi:hypothetical protein
MLLSSVRSPLFFGLCLVSQAACVLTVDVAMVVAAHMQARPAPDVPRTNGRVPTTCGRNHWQW